MWACGDSMSNFPTHAPTFSYAGQQFTKTSEPFNDRMFVMILPVFYNHYNWVV